MPSCTIVYLHFANLCTLVYPSYCVLTLYLHINNLKQIKEMSTLKVLFMFFCLSLSTQVYAVEEKEEISKEDKWGKTNERDISSPRLYQDESSVYVYSEKQLDNVSIGITDMQGNTYHYEVTTIPAGMYYAVSIESLPAGQYYLYVYQGSNYIIGMLTI